MIPAWKRAFPPLTAKYNYSVLFLTYAKKVRKRKETNLQAYFFFQNDHPAIISPLRGWRRWTENQSLTKQTAFPAGQTCFLSHQTSRLSD